MHNGSLNQILFISPLQGLPNWSKADPIDQPT